MASMEKLKNNCPYAGENPAFPTKLSKIRSMAGPPPDEGLMVVRLNHLGP